MLKKSCSRFIVVAALVLGPGGLLPVKAQLGPIELHTDGKKVSPWVYGVENSASPLALGFFLKSGYAYESNLFDSPNHFRNLGTNQARQFPSSVNMMQDGTAWYSATGAEMNWDLGQHRLRFMAAAQNYRVPGKDMPAFLDDGKFNGLLESLADKSSWNLYMQHRWNLLPWLEQQTLLQMDRNYAKNTDIFGRAALGNGEDFLHNEATVEYLANTPAPPGLGRGQASLMLQARHREYSPSIKNVPYWMADSILLIEKDGPLLNAFNFNDTLNADYLQWRGRLRHIQGMRHGFSSRVSFDLIKRDYSDMLAKLIKDTTRVPAVDMGDIPVIPIYNSDSVVIGTMPPPGHPKRSQSEYRAYAGLQYDPPHVNHLRLQVGWQWLKVTDPYQGFYGYTQRGLFASTIYAPSSLAHIELAMRVSQRTYDELLANLQYWAPRGVNQVEFNNGAPVKTVTIDELGNPRNIYDISYQGATRLATQSVAVSLRGQLPVWRNLALWAHMFLDMRNSNRPDTEMLSREYYNHLVGAGITVYMDYNHKKRGDL